PVTGSPRLLLLQIRTNPVSLRQEHEWFAERLEIPASVLQTINLVDRPELRWRDVDPYDAVLIGGAGAHTAYEDHPFTGPLERVVLGLIERDRPLFGSCWGHQFLARVLGGTVVNDPAAEEVGTFEIELTPEGRRDPLFAPLPPAFAAQLGHHDRIGVLPPDLVELARSERCPCQAVRMPGRPVYGTQFHPEMTDGQLRERLEVYRDAYLPDPEGYRRLLANLRPSPEAGSLLRRFLELYVL
ncbi:MAG TPA: type 1 glutamine amidotransferase, partial [Acidobacteria bacterium]|nr:type 1 glutamine amidotransferase [Acidobacteriota bacterium]